MPVLQFLQPGQLEIDAAYQRSVATGPSHTLIRRIAQHWNWDLCQPLVVSRRREDGGVRYLVIDGQHRLEAAKRRGDIAQLPCVVVEYANAADEAASFVHLNQQRRPLGKLTIFKAAVASEDPEACAILKALEEAGLSVAPHSNHTVWKPGMVANIGGIESAWRQSGPGVTSAALRCLAQAWPGQVLQYGGSLFPGIVAVLDDEAQMRTAEAAVPGLAAMVGRRTQRDWRGLILQARAADPNLRFATASARVVRDVWQGNSGVFVPAAVPERKIGADKSPAPPPTKTLLPGITPGADGKLWCEQCDMRVTVAEATGCKSRFCSLKVAP